MSFTNRGGIPIGGASSSTQPPSSEANTPIFSKPQFLNSTTDTGDLESQQQSPLTSARKFSLSEAFNSNPFDFGGRSYVSMSHRSPYVNNSNSPFVNTGDDVHEQSAILSNIAVMGSDGDVESALEVEDEYITHSTSIPTPIGGKITPQQHQRQQQLQQQFLVSNESLPLISNTAKYTDEPPSPHPDLEMHLNIRDKLHHSEKPPVPSKLHQYLVKPVGYLPAVFLGTLLNILDGLSYGMIMFPIGEAVFSSLAPTGLSMFYMSCIVSQLIYSLGGSAFKTGIGSEMIEVTPFFHTMALSIANLMTGESDDAIIATTITTYAISSLVTGTVFYILGKCNLGVLVGFFPRHILVGCIGGVGYFLVVTGIEVSSRLEGGLQYNWDTFNFLFHSSLWQWTTPLFLTLLLILLQHRVHNTMLVPAYFILVFIIFHLVVLVVPSWNLNLARDSGWIFPLVEGNEPWYNFYTLYKFPLVDWYCIIKQIPTMLALTFFGILHVPINVPALAVTLGMDTVDVNRELVAHGYSNFISGLMGSIQNYLVYTNSVLFIRAGAGTEDRIAGVLLAFATIGVMVVGPVVIGYIPVCVVGALIFLLGYELLKEAVYDTYGRLRIIEYSTILIIVITMGVVDFVAGILVGILLACLSFVVEAGRSPVVSGVYSGSVARSTVLRHPKQQEFLKDVGDQICIVKLQGTIFFGSIGGVETKIRTKFTADQFSNNPLKYLILDMKDVLSIDFSASEGFRRVLNLADQFGTKLIISSVEEDGDMVRGLRDAGLFDSEPRVILFSSLNYALEWCENCFLKTYRRIKTNSVQAAATNSTGSTSPSRLIPPKPSIPKYPIGTPRTTQIFHAATKTLNESPKPSSLSKKPQPLPLLMITFHLLSEQSEQFWTPLASCFIKETIPKDYTFYDTSTSSPQFFLVETGLIRSVIMFENEGRSLHSSILPLVAFGDMTDVKKFRRCVYTTVSESVVWRLDMEKLKSIDQDVVNELLRIEGLLVRERFDSMTANLIISG
ncbi:putative vacuolar membrane protein [Spathaspora sp. JA1]|nr:putative vacuolar membrane protein [Spathaspora sp. JA1]